MLSEKIEVYIVLYAKQKDGIKITISSELENILTNKGTS